MDSSHIQDITINVAVITVSTSRDEKTDVSGKTICEMAREKNLDVGYYKVVTDDVDMLRKAFHEAVSSSNCIIFNGGTGLTHDDCTIEAISPLFDKSIDGFGELFRIKSYEDIGTRAILSRAVAGVYKSRAVFCIPGSTAAVKLAMKEIILPEIKHILTHSSK